MAARVGTLTRRAPTRCERGDLNPHGFPHWILSPARLPVPPLSLSRCPARGDLQGLPEKSSEFRVPVSCVPGRRRSVLLTVSHQPTAGSPPVGAPAVCRVSGGSQNVNRFDSSVGAMGAAIRNADSPGGVCDAPVLVVPAPHTGAASCRTSSGRSRSVGRPSGRSGALGHRQRPEAAGGYLSLHSTSIVIPPDSKTLTPTCQRKSEVPQRLLKNMLRQL